MKKLYFNNWKMKNHTPSSKQSRYHGSDRQKIVDMERSEGDMASYPKSYEIERLMLYSSGLHSLGGAYDVVKPYKSNLRHIVARTSHIW